MRDATDDAQRKSAHDAYGSQSIGFYTALNSEYDAKFKVTAIVLRDELLTRVKRPQPDGPEAHMYEHPTNPIGMGIVADDLERLALLLRFKRENAPISS
jgi:hypothetical protein